MLYYYKENKNDFNSSFDAWKCSWLLAKRPYHCNEREIEWPWVMERMDNTKKKVLDVGSMGKKYPKVLVDQGYDVVALDVQLPKNNKLPYATVQGDIRHTVFSDNMFDIVTAVSILEHVGIKGRFGITEEDAVGDLKAMKEIYRILKKYGTALITIPYGQKSIMPINKCYNKEKTKEIFKGFNVVEEQYYVFKNDFQWHCVDEKEAALVDWYVSPWYALAFFHLRK